METKKPKNQKKMIGNQKNNEKFDVLGTKISPEMSEVRTRYAMPCKWMCTICSSGLSIRSYAQVVRSMSSHRRFAN